MGNEVVIFQEESDTRIKLRANPQRRSLKGILLFFMEPYMPGNRDSEKFINPDLTKVIATVNGSPNIWEEVSRFFVKTTNKTQHINLTKFYTEDKFRLLIDLCSMENHALYCSGTSLANTKDAFQLELEREANGSGNVNCHVFVISDAQMNIKNRNCNLCNTK